MALRCIEGVLSRGEGGMWLRLRSMAALWEAMAGTDEGMSGCDALKAAVAAASMSWMAVLC